MSDTPKVEKPGTGNIKYRTSDNSYKFYWKGKNLSIDYPSVFIGVMTPSTFIFTKMNHMYDIMEMALTNPKSTEPVIVSGQDEYTAVEFLQAIRESQSWRFERGLVVKTQK